MEIHKRTLVHTDTLKQVLDKDIQASKSHKLIHIHTDMKRYKHTCKRYISCKFIRRHKWDKNLRKKIPCVLTQYRI